MCVLVLVVIVVMGKVGVGSCQETRGFFSTLTDFSAPRTHRREAAAHGFLAALVRSRGRLRGRQLDRSPPGQAGRVAGARTRWTSGFFGAAGWHDANTASLLSLCIKLESGNHPVSHGCPVSSGIPTRRQRSQIRHPEPDTARRPGPSLSIGCRDWSSGGRGSSQQSERMQPFRRGS
ncbi:hypothetical protein LZ31DRAFT_256261 [Colletotrichum somersetense]|nr:hypothetical protein LZ31DRAFT_256261 [Colletotrichum somersetense]